MAGFEGLSKTQEISVLYDRFKEDITNINWCHCLGIVSVCDRKSSTRVWPLLHLSFLFEGLLDGLLIICGTRSSRVCSWWIRALGLVWGFQQASCVLCLMQLSQCGLAPLHVSKSWILHRSQCAALFFLSSSVGKRHCPFFHLMHNLQLSCPSSYRQLYAAWPPRVRQWLQQFSGTSSSAGLGVVWEAVDVRGAAGVVETLRK
jgi:hypothetical protein